jgi:hypothetical protein
MSINSATTENSHMNSESLENFEKRLRADKVTLKQAVADLVKFASQKLEMHLNEGQINRKVDQVGREVDRNELLI